jgi:DNA primase
VCCSLPKNEKGQIIDLYGRSINPNGEGKHFYLNGKHQGIYPGYPNTKTTKLILTECLIDAATLEQQAEINEHYTILSLYGTNGFTSEIETAVKELQELEEVILFFDGDKAGNDAAIRTAEKLKTIKPQLTITKVDTPEEEDINSLLQGHEPEILNHLINERKPINQEKEQGNDTEATPEPSQLNTDNPDKITYQENQLQFIIWGGIEKDNIHRLKLNLLVQLKGDGFRYYQDDVNLYSNGQLQRYIKGAAKNWK